jgi:hypothetical protein
MKTKYLFVATLVMVSSVITAVGKDAPSKAGLAIVPVKGSEVFKVIYKGETVGRVRMNLYNSSNVLVYAQSMSNVEGFILPLNFKGLAFGEYTLEVIDSNGKRTEKIDYTASKSVIRVAKLAEEGKFLLAIMNPANSSVSVRIFNSADELIHAETKEIKGDFAQVYKVINTKAVTFEVSDNAGNVQIIRY